MFTTPVNLLLQPTEFPAKHLLTFSDILKADFSWSLLSFSVCENEKFCHNLKGSKQVLAEIVNSDFCNSKQPESEMLQMV